MKGSTVTAAKPLSQPKMPLALFVLTLSTFIIGTSEFVIMGLLPNVAHDLSVSIPAAGWLITGYALGVAIGGPLVALSTVRIPRKTSLLLLQLVFLLGNLLSALAPNYGYLMLARIITSLGQGASFGIGAVMAASLVAEERRASAIAIMFAGLTLANVAGIPLGTAIGQWAGWRVAFWPIAGMSALALIGLWRTLPSNREEEHIHVGNELRALRDLRIWWALGTSIIFAASYFTLFTYTAPMLGQLSGVSPHGITLSLFLIGSGLTIGNIVGGKLSDWNLDLALTGIAVAIALASILLRWASHSIWSAEVGWFVWSIAAFSAIPTLQVNVMRFGGKAPNLVSTLNIAAFNAGIALGARVGGAVLDSGHTLAALPIAASVLAVLAALATRVNRRLALRQAEPSITLS